MDPARWPLRSNHASSCVLAPDRKVSRFADAEIIFPSASSGADTFRATTIGFAGNFEP